MEAKCYRIINRTAKYLKGNDIKSFTELLNPQQINVVEFNSKRKVNAIESFYFFAIL